MAQVALSVCSISDLHVAYNIISVDIELPFWSRKSEIVIVAALEDNIMTESSASCMDYDLSIEMWNKIGYFFLIVVLIKFEYNSCSVDFIAKRTKEMRLTVWILYIQNGIFQFWVDQELHFHSSI